MYPRLMLYFSHCTASCPSPQGVPPEGEDSPEDDGLHAVRVGLGVDERQGAAPAPSEHHPAGDAQVLPELLQI